MFTPRSAPFLTLSRRLGRQNRLCFDLQQVRKLYFVYISAAETHYLRCSCVVFACHAGLVMSFQLRTPGHSHPSYWAGWRRVMTKKSDSAQSRSFCCCKRTVFKSTGRQVAIVCINQKSVTFWYQHEKIRPRTARKRNQSWVCHGKIKTFLPACHHAARTSLDGEWTTWSSQLTTKTHQKSRGACEAHDHSAGSAVASATCTRSWRRTW